MFCEKIILFSLIGLSASFPVAQEDAVEIQPELISEKVVGVWEKGGVKVNKSPKQDEDGGGADGAEAAAGIGGIGNNLQQIVSGAVSGNLGSIFGGSTSFIGDSGTRNAVSGLLTQLNKALTQLITGSLNQLSTATRTTQRSVVTAAATRATTEGIKFQIISIPGK